MLHNKFIRGLSSLPAFCLLLGSISLSAQVDFAPVGAQWRYNAHIETINPAYGARQYRYVVTADTTVQGRAARKIQYESWENGGFVPFAPSTRLVSTTGDKVYHWVDTSFVLLFDFGAQPGDTIVSAMSNRPAGLYSNPGYDSPYETIPFSYVIDSLGTLSVNGASLRVQYVRNTAGFFEESWHISGFYPSDSVYTLIEKIGPYPSGLWFGSGAIVAPPEGSPLSTLRCYQDETLYFEGNTLGLPCDSVVATRTLWPDIDCLVTFSRSSNQIYVHIPDDITESLQFCLADLLGHSVLCTSVKAGTNILPTTALPLGIYVWTVNDGQVLRQRGKIYRD